MNETHTDKDKDGMKGEETMKTVADKQLLMAADFAGYPLKEEIKE